MGIAFAILLGVIVAIFGVLPLFRLYGHTIQARPRFVPLDFSHLPEVQSTQIQRVIETLKKETFVPETYLRLMEDSRHPIQYFILLTNRVNRGTALVMITVPPVATTKVPVAGEVEVTFLTRFTDGTVLETHNSRRLAYTPSLPNEIHNFLPSIRDLHRLYQLHCFSIEEHNLHIRAGKVLHDEGMATEFLTTMMEESCTAQEENGYLIRDPRSREPIYHLTRKGAYLTTWSNLFPVTVVRWLVRLIREREILDNFRRSPWGIALMGR